MQRTSSGAYPASGELSAEGSDGSKGTGGSTRVSLLWPPSRHPQAGPARLGDGTIADLDLHEVIRVLAGNDERRERFVTGILADLNTDPEVIRHRQAIIADLFQDAELCERLREVLLALGTLLAERGSMQRAAWSVSQIARRVRELEQYVAVAVLLRDALEGALPRSAGLQVLRAHLVALTSTPAFRSLQAELPELRATLDRVGSITIGINLTKDLSPDSATILSIDTEKVEGRAPFLERLFGKGGPRGLTTLYDVDLGNPQNSLYRDLRKLLEVVVGPVQEVIRRYTMVNAYGLADLEPELFLLLNAVALAKRLEAAGLPVCLPEIAPMDGRIAQIEEGYNVSLTLRTIAGASARTSPGAPPGTLPSRPPGASPQSARLSARAPVPIQHQLPDDWSLRPADSGTVSGCKATGGMPAAVVTNTIRFGEAHARIWILTGPNRGGKTTYTRAVGQAQVLFQAGLHVPGHAARLSPADAIYTHFATQESAEVGMGRLDEEARRLAHIFTVATERSLILLNEVLAGTSTIEALGMAVDAVRGLRLLGARAVYTTHLHELAARAEEINTTTPGTAIVGSLVAEAESGTQPSGEGGAGQHGRYVEHGGHDGQRAVIGPRHRRTFRIVPSPPRNVSYASEIAEQHGISFAQLVQLFEGRGLIDGEAAVAAVRSAP